MQRKRIGRVYNGRVGPYETAGQIKQIVASRQQRAADTKRWILKGGVIGTIGGLGIGLMGRPSSRNGAIVALASAITGMASGGALTYASGAKKVKTATLALGKTLSKEAKQNDDLRFFLGKYRYVIVNRNGLIKGTNRPRIYGIGRYRLESKKIIKGEY